MKVNTGDVNAASRTKQMSNLIYKYMRPEHLPQIWCPGCGNGIIMRDVAQAIENLGLSRNQTVIVSGIGCSSRAAGYIRSTPPTAGPLPSLRASSWPIPSWRSS